MAGLQDLIRRFDAGGSTAPVFSTDPTLNASWNALAGKTGDDITAQRQALAQQNAAYQTNQNLANMYGITEAPAQKQFLTDFNTATANPNFHYTSQATTNPNMGYQLNPSEQFIKSLVEANTASPGKGSGNAIMNQFLGDSKTTGNPFLGEYTMGGTLGVPVRKDAFGNPIQSIGALTSQQLTDLRNGPIPTYTNASQSTNAVGDVFTTKFGGILDQYTDKNGYLHITAGGKDYLINPKSNRILGVGPIGSYGSNNMASGGSVGMPDSYSQGNWKLI